MPFLTSRRLPAWVLTAGLIAGPIAGLAVGGLPAAAPKSGTTRAPVALAAATPKKPSIVLILVDDFSTELLATMANGARMQRYLRDLVQYRTHQAASAWETMATTTAQQHLGPILD